MVSLFSPLPKNEKNIFSCTNVMLIQGTGLTTQRVGVGGYYFLLQKCTEVLPGCCGWQRPEEEPFSQRSAIGITGGGPIIYCPLKSFGSEVGQKG